MRLIHPVLRGEVSALSSALRKAAPALLIAFLVASLPVVRSADARLVAVEKIWDRAEHNAFTDLIWFQDHWICTFREGHAHGSPDGKVRVLVSTNGREWNSGAVLEEAGIDLRDPKLSITPDGRLMLVMGGSVMRNGQYVGRQTRVAFSPDGRSWSRPQKILQPGDWLWRVTWFRGTAYGVSYLGGGGLRNVKRAAFLHQSQDGVAWTLITPLELPGASETTLRFLDDGEMIALSVNMERTPRATKIGSSKPPYREWIWRDVPFAIGGPNFILLPDGRWIAGCRHTVDGTSRTVLAIMTRTGLEPFLTFPSDGDNSYPGLVRMGDELWMSYYSSHEGKASIYLARIRLDEK